MSTNNKPIVFYDGSCPLCKKEISHYIKLDKAENLIWCDISNDVALLDYYGISYDQAMKRLHAVSYEGKIVIGVDAFLMLWLQLPYYRYLSRTLKFWGLNKPLNYLYVRFADWRFSKQQCSVAEGNKCRNSD
ncbi:thiol-disulfide oxidoreductase DCC family protein [Neptuniibacter sp.]|uniref:thiol-disulfide oxidoreductase DCC family protein n=1 Tax=Neptuniibacter sp. TaxID=1962643 RepID=UPI00261DA803|nr:DUF393 domain-containing protein [Neptuniibacter sp.]MCP4596286.1 DUF393 domain-containing protein [Neptuniibacter sp.]